MRILITVLFIAMLCGGAAAGEEACVPAQGDPVRIGMVFPPDTLFGSLAADSYQGAAAMAEAINVCGGVAGRPVALVGASAANRNAALAAVDALSHDVPVVVGSGMAVVSDVLAQAAGEDTFFYWEVSEPLDAPHAYALAARPNNAQLGAQAAAYVNSDVVALLDETQQLNVALVYEDNARARAVADGVRQALAAPPLIDQSVTTSGREGYQLAVRMREQRVNVAIVVVFERDADRLWVDLRQADANLTAWVQVGGDQYRHNICSRIGNTDGIVSISAAGPISQAYREMTAGPVYAAYLDAYENLFGHAPGEKADLAASGMYVLLREILPQVADDDYTPAAVQQAAASATSAVDSALMGEGWAADPVTWTNQAAVAVVAQQQNGAFCTLAPGAAATCQLPLQPLPTWRIRARDSSC